VTTLTNWLEQSIENRRVYSQEGLILEISELIWGELEKRNWNQARLAQELGKSKAHVSQLLNGSRNMTLRTLSDIAFALGLEVRVGFCEPGHAEDWESITAVIVKRPHVVGRQPITAANDEWTAPVSVAA